MWSIKKILVPTDFSKPSEAALNAAIDVAKKFEASIVLVHAYQLPTYPYPMSPPMLTPLDLSAHVEQGAQKALEEIVVSQAASGVSIATALRAGPAWEQILRAAKDFDVGLIVIGSRGLRGLPRALMGSTAERVVRYASVPVITLHGPVATDLATSQGAKEADELVDRWLL